MKVFIGMQCKLWLAAVTLGEVGEHYIPLDYAELTDRIAIMFKVGSQN